MRRFFVVLILIFLIVLDYFFVVQREGFYRHMNLMSRLYIHFSGVIVPGRIVEDGSDFYFVSPRRSFDIVSLDFDQNMVAEFESAIDQLTDKSTQFSKNLSKLNFGDVITSLDKKNQKTGSPRHYVAIHESQLDAQLRGKMMEFLQLEFPSVSEEKIARVVSIGTKDAKAICSTFFYQLDGPKVVAITVLQNQWLKSVTSERRMECYKEELLHIATGWADLPANEFATFFQKGETYEPFKYYEDLSPSDIEMLQIHLSSNLPEGANWEQAKKTFPAQIQETRDNRNFISYVRARLSGELSYQTASYGSAGADIAKNFSFWLLTLWFYENLRA